MRLVNSLSVFILACLTQSAFGAPSIETMVPRALRIGSTTSITIKGKELHGEPKIVLPIAITQKVVSSSANEAKIEVTVPDSVAVDFYSFRIATKNGISQPIVVSIDGLRQRDISDHLQPPEAVVGSLTGNKVRRVTFDGKSGQRLVVDVEAARIGSKLRPVVRIYSPDGKQIAYARPQPSLSGDCRTEVTLEQSGTYELEIHDRLYRGSSPGHFRLKIGNLQFAKHLLPHALPMGDWSTARIVTTERMAAQANKVSMLVNSPASSMHRIPWQSGMNTIGPSVHVQVGSVAQIVESDAKAAVAVPVGISGVLSEAKMPDNFDLVVRPKQKLRFRLGASEIGSPLDGVLVIRDKDGKELARADDQQSTVDPQTDFTVPDGTEHIRVEVTDLLRRGGPEFIYHLMITELRPSIDVTCGSASLNVPANGRLVVPIKINRQGDNGAIQFGSIRNASGFHVAPLKCYADTSDALLAIESNSTSSLGFVSILATGQSGRFVRALNSVLDVDQHDIALATFEQPRLSVDWSDARAAATQLTQGVSFKTKLILVRPESKQKVRLALVTTQPMPKRKENNKDVDDPSRALRLGGMTTVASDQSSPDIEVIVPHDLPDKYWQMCVRAELMSEDEKSVVATSYTNVINVTAQRALDLMVNDVNVKAAKGDGETGKLTGKVQRRGGYSRPIKLSFVGLKDVKSPELTLEEGKSEFEFEIRFPKEAKPEQVKDAKLVATSAPNEKEAGRVVRSNEVPIKVELK